MRNLLLLACLTMPLLAHADDSPPSSSSTPSRSASQEQDLIRQLPTPQQLWLGEGEQRFLGLYLPAARPEPLGGVVLIGDRGEHADWPELLAPARRSLSRAGWHTLAISLPDSPQQPQDSTLEQVQNLNDQYRTQVEARIDLASNHLHEQDLAQFILLARGEGAYWALSHAQDKTPEQLAGLILFLPRRPQTAQLSIESLLEEWDKPLLEIFIGNDPVQQEQISLRRQNAQRLQQPAYQAITSPELHATTVSQAMLVKRLEGWLAKLPPPDADD